MEFVGDCSPDEPSTKRSSDLEKAVSDLEASVAATSGNGKKIGGSKDTGHSVRNSINKSTSQIKKPPHRKTVSPLNWFPRKKGDSFLKRKIKHLQEIGGMNLSLDETLGNANPHYTRIAREKIAAQQAARKAMEARKAAMVEASWCRILGAARIRSQEAEMRLEKAEKYAEEAFNVARAMGVMMYDKPDSKNRPCEIETALSIGGRSTHKVTASFETAFEVDKEVAAAVKRALMRLANCSSSLNKEEFRDMIFKINQNPDSNNIIEAPIDLSSECEIPGAELQQDSHISGDSGEQSFTGLEDRKRKNSLLRAINGSGCSMSPTDLTDAMLDRLKCLHEDEVSSLAVIVATCGLNAALREIQTIENNDLEPISSEIPSLDKFLVKHVSKLEKEVQEAKKNSMVLENQRLPGALVNQVFEKKSSVKEGGWSKELKVESEIHSMRTNRIEPSSESIPCQEGKQHNSDKELLEGISGMSLNMGCEKVITQKQKEDTKNPSIMKIMPENFERLASDDSGQQNKENLDVIPAYGKNQPIKCMSRIERAKIEVSKTFSAPNDIGDETHKVMGLDKLLVKPIHRLEKEKMEVREHRRDQAVLRENKKHETHVTAPDSLDTILVKHVSRLEKEKLALAANEGLKTVKKSNKQCEESEGSLGEVLVKHQSKLEKAKISATQQSADYIKHETRREARQRELQEEVWGGLSLENSIRPHLSRIEQEKAAWKKAEEEERLREMDLQYKIE